MSKENQKSDSAADFLDRLFGNVEELVGEDLDILFEVVARGEDPAERVWVLAEEAAVKYRKQNKIPPEHVKRALVATRKGTLPASASKSMLDKIVNQVLQPEHGPVNDPAFAYRGLREDEVTEQDRDILNGLEQELKQNWSDEEEK